VLAVVQLLDDDVLVVLKHLRQLRQIVGLAIMHDDNPLDILKTDGLAAHRLGTFPKHAHVHIMKRCHNRYLVHIFIFY
jgi:hypothetical protein